MYKHPSQEIALYLQSEGLLDARQFFVDFRPELEQVDSDLVVIIQMINGTPNPRWLRDNINIVIQVVGQDKTLGVAARDKLWEIYNKLLGAYNIEKDGYTYFQFTSQSMPNFVGYLENAKPLYTSSLSFVREAQTKEGNRDVIS